MKKKILIVDDADISRDILADLLEETYDILEAKNGQEALELLRKRQDEISAVLLDLRMPEMDGYEVCEYLKEEGIIYDIPIIVLTGDMSIESEMRCFDLGIFDYIRKPFSNVLLLHRVENAVLVREKRLSVEGELARQNVLLQKTVKKLKEQKERLQGQLEETIEMFGAICEYRRSDASVRMRQIKDYIRIIGEQYMEQNPDSQLTTGMLKRIIACSPLYDIGKIELPEKVIMKQGRLTEQEYDLIKSHASRGCDIVKNFQMIKNSEYEDICQDICKYHHERYDGTGYPEGLSEDKIPISAQIVGIVDAYDALIHDTVYRMALPEERAFEMIVTGECGTFSPKILEAFYRSRKKLEEVQH